MKKILFAIAALLVSYTAQPVTAAPISTDTYYSFGFGGVGSSLDGTLGQVPCTNPACVNAPGDVWDITLTTSSILTVLDLFLVGDQFEIFDGVSSLGVTSIPGTSGSCGSDWTCALNDPDYSVGTFLLGPGTYSLSGTVAASPFGGGAGAFHIAAVPLPATLPLLAGALFLGGMLRRRNKS